MIGADFQSPAEPFAADFDSALIRTKMTPQRTKEIVPSHESKSRAQAAEM
jgi:hypothetical protein